MSNKFRKLALASFTAILLMAIGAIAADSYPAVPDLPRREAIPDPMVTLAGRPVKTKLQWFKRRKPELKLLFQHYMYGWFPPAVGVTGVVNYTNPAFLNGKATLKLVTLSLSNHPTPIIHLLMIVPNQRSTPAPVFAGMNFNGNFALVSDTNVPLEGWMSSKAPHVVDNHATEASRGTDTNTWPFEQCVDRGYAVATYYCGDVEQDRSGAEGGVRETIKVPRAPDDWGTIAAWAWGLQRVMDYLVTDPDIDSRRIALVGHSRLGKAAILAGAFDDRAALVIPLQAGCGGTAPSRSHTGESVNQINTKFPEWFCGLFKEFNDQTERLPFDQNCLIALCAPRPVLLGAATEDQWANPLGAFEMLQSASKVYQFLGRDGLAAETMPATNQLVDSTLGFFIRPGKHSMTREDWKYFLDFADKRLPAPAAQHRRPAG